MYPPICASFLPRSDRWPVFAPQGDDPATKEFRKAVRGLVNRLHRQTPRAGGKGDKPRPAEDAEQEQTTLAALSPEVQSFVQHFLERWHAQLSQRPPRVVAKRMQKGAGSLPPGLEEDRLRWLCRFLARWHRKHAGKCDVMSGWSSGETGDDTSGDEGSASRRVRQGRGGRRGEGALSESEDTDCLEKVLSSFS